MPDGTPEHRDVIGLLEAQHREIRSLFDRVEGASGEARKDAFQDLVRLLAVHETAEEEVVHPMVRRLDGAEPIVAARIEEESDAKHQLAALEDMDHDSPEFDQQLAMVRSAVLRHAEAEESHEFPLMRTDMDRDEREKMADRVRRAEAMAPTRPHPHGPDSAIGNMLVGPFVAIADRIRDALRD